MNYPLIKTKQYVDKTWQGFLVWENFAQVIDHPPAKTSFAARKFVLQNLEERRNERIGG